MQKVSAQGKLEASKQLPAFPADCYKTMPTELQKGKRLDVELMRIRMNLERQNARTLTCAQWYDELRKGYGKT